MKGIIIPEIDEKALEEVKEKTYNELINDEDVLEFIAFNHLSLDFVKKNVYYFNLYQKDLKMCKNCDGLSSCPKKENHLQLLLKLDRNHNLTFGYKKCKYELELDKIKKKYTTRQFPNSMMKYKIKDLLQTFAIERAPVVKKMLEFRKNPTEKGIYISGSKGVGKSFILAVFSIYLAKVEETTSLCFIDCGNDFKSLERLFSENLNYFNYYIEDMKSSQYLFLDDLGKEFKNQFILENILLPVLKERKEKKKATFISSNYSIKDLRHSYTYSKESYLLSRELMKLIEETSSEFTLEGLPYNKIK